MMEARCSLLNNLVSGSHFSRVRSICHARPGPKTFVKFDPHMLPARLAAT